MQLTEALELLLTEASPLSAERVPVWNACHRVASEDVVAPSRCHTSDEQRWMATSSTTPISERRLPERPVRLRITGAAAMGAPPGSGPGQGEVWAITTGAPMPASGDRVVPLEAARPARDFVQINRPVTGRRNVAEPGEDIRAGTRLLATGDVIMAEAAAALAAAGVREIGVRRRLRAGIVATGTELVDLAADTASLPRDAYSTAIPSRFAARSKRWAAWSNTGASCRTSGRRYGRRSPRWPASTMS